ncbi:fol3 Probable dihydrofolate synthetase [Candida maltosa Xu316]|uniref:Mur ligase C-terminal domain-containing protein n=1 Tax=Candida maltosa (strain Xu316) TaxID=1245528 RepID=M3JXX8_CANMX|nr:hypothetical protein G210_2416 [Candida maltosa Xu316]
MPIDLGLARITKLLGHLNNPQHAYKSIHIAGTNGKGSTLAYISSILTQANIKNGKFTSPHIINYHDCITINNQTYPKSKFDQINESVIQVNNDLDLQCTEFEILTATAFKIFAVEKIEMALIEVGVGGRLDATNVLVPYDGKFGVIATGITKIGLDHEKLLGGSLSAIAQEKAGIIKYKIPCFVDCSNDEVVLDTIRAKAEESLAPLYIVEPNRDFIKFSPLQGSYQVNNLSLALQIIKCLPYKITDEVIEQGVSKTHWPGRLQLIQHKNLGEILIDGAHNESAAIELGNYLKEKYGSESIVFIIGMTKGKAVDNVLKHILKENDVVIPTLFSQPDNMPWIKPESIKRLGNAAKKYSNIRMLNDDNVHIGQVFKYLEKEETLLNRPIVICGSLYLCGDVLREV